VNRYDAPVQKAAGAQESSEGRDTVRLSALAVSRVPARWCPLTNGNSWRSCARLL